MSKQSKSTPSPKNRPPAKPYQSPKVRAYGNIHDITRGTGRTGQTDNPVLHGRPNKTGA